MEAGTTTNVPSLWVPLLAGGIAGTVTDITLFPLDTLKTRLQQGGPRGGHMLRNLYSGLGPAALIAGPSAACFFVVYDLAKRDVFRDTPLGHGQAAALAEVAACLVKVPFEVVKQRQQAGETSLTSFQLGRRILTTEGIRGSYSGLGATIIREIPFGFIQMPLYEFLKAQLLSRKVTDSLSNVEACGCGAVAGGVAALVTCPIDVWKTRLMLGDKNTTIWKIARQEGWRTLFSGAVPRVAWISVGGSLFFGVYEFARKELIHFLK
jgi:solute carrier family 25 (mitochondrial S-adenosylmethionine transporter), member 26